MTTRLRARNRRDKSARPLFLAYIFAPILLCILKPDLTFSEEQKALVFSETEHEKERRIVYNLRKSKIQALIQTPTMDKRPNTYAIYVALTDLNNDGRNDILAFIRHDLCGSWGCELLVLISKPNGKWQVALENVITDEPVFVSETETKGVKDLMLRSTRWSWNGVSYK